MKKKVFFIISSLSPGGSERVFWLLSQGFDKTIFEVFLVVLDGRHNCYSASLEGVKLIDLKAGRAIYSVFKLYRLLKEESPYAVFSTTDHINILVAFVSVFVRIPNLIARASNIPDQMRKYENTKGRFWNSFTRFCYRRYHLIVCQSDEMRQGIYLHYQVKPEKLEVIPNPVLHTRLFKEMATVDAKTRLIVVARLSGEKGILRLLDIVAGLPTNYLLTIVGDGPLRTQVLSKISHLHLKDRIQLISESRNVTGLIALHDLFVLTSFTEGFPNVILEALSVGIPVITFRVGGVTGLIKDGINGYIVEQGDVSRFREAIVLASDTAWDHASIKQDVLNTYALEKIADEYESLIS